jgi:hypothetical protein
LACPTKSRASGAAQICAHLVHRLGRLRGVAFVALCSQSRRSFFPLEANGCKTFFFSTAELVQLAEHLKNVFSLHFFDNLFLGALLAFLCSICTEVKKTQTFHFLIVTLLDFYSYRLIGKLTAFLQFQEFSHHNQTWDLRVFTFAT